MQEIHYKPPPEINAHNETYMYKMSMINISIFLICRQNVTLERTHELTPDFY